MMKIGKSKELHGWDDEKIYFWDQESKKEWCVSYEEDLYNRLVRICKTHLRQLFRFGETYVQ